jgi:hypothetical protein
MAMAGPILTGATALIGGVQGFTAGGYQSAVAKNNARIAETNAVRAFEDSQTEKMDNDFDIANILGEQTAAQGASGLALSSRSAAAVRDTTRKTGQIEGGRIIAEGLSKAHNFRQQAADFKAEGKAAKVKGYFDLAGGIVGAAAAVAGGKSAYQGQSIASGAKPSLYEGRFIPRPRLKPDNFRQANYPPYGGPR